MRFPSSALPGYWDSFGTNIQPSAANAAWRNYCDELNRNWLSRVLAGRSFQHPCKTDLYDEVAGSGPMQAVAAPCTGIDLAPSIAASAAAHPHVKSALAADVRHLPFRDASFDLAVSISTLDHFPNPASIPQALAEIRRTLQPGGLLAITLDNLAHPLVRFRNSLPFSFLHRLGLVPAYVGSTLTPAGLRAALSAAGFRVLETGTLMHTPRPLLVPLAGTPLWPLIQPFLRAAELLGSLPTAAFTGYFITALAEAASAPPPSPWPQTPQADLARRFLPRAVQLTPSALVANANVRLHLLSIEGNVIPVTEPPETATPTPSDHVSPWSHYVRYPANEMRRQPLTPAALLSRAALAAASPVLRWSGISNTVIANNWLLSTVPVPNLSASGVVQLRDELLARFPSRAILFRAVVPTLRPELAANLRRAGFRLIPARTVHLLFPGGPRKRDTAADLKLLRDGVCEIVSHDELTPADMSRLAEFYSQLYLGKHSPLNAACTPEFFLTAWRQRFLEFRAIRHQGVIGAFNTWFEHDGLLHSAIVGYDLSAPRHLNLFRRATCLLLEHAAHRSIPLHWSSGAGRFKKLRGAIPHIEYEAVYDAHLSSRRRLAWRILENTEWIQFRKIERGS